MKELTIFTCSCNLQGNSVNWKIAARPGRTSIAHFICRQMSIVRRSASETPAKRRKPPRIAPARLSKK
jgi:hypothetical protein